jgi:hypothetical protein
MQPTLRFTCSLHLGSWFSIPNVDVFPSAPHWFVCTSRNIKIKFIFKWACFFFALKVLQEKWSRGLHMKLLTAASLGAFNLRTDLLLSPARDLHADTSWVLLLAKREEKRGVQRKLHDEVFHNLYSLLKIIRTNELRRMGRCRHVKRIADEINGWPSDSDIVVRQQSMIIGLSGPKPRMIMLARASRK